MQKQLFSAAFALCLAAGSAWGQTSAQTLQFDIDMRAEIHAGRFNPQTDRVGLRGNTAPLAWDKSLPLQAAVTGPEAGKEADREAGHYRATLQLPQAAQPGHSLQYKLKIDRPGMGPGDGWEDGRNHSLALDSPSPTVQRAFNAPPAMPALSRVGTIVRLPALQSTQVGPRGVQVWLPPGYADNAQRRYPVLYLHDGQAVFDTAVNAAEWRVDETAQRLVESGKIAPCIIVAVDNTHDRIAEYTPVPGRLSSRPSASHQPVGGKAPDYARYLVEELKPQIDRLYRTQPQARFTSVGGSSLGGLVSLWMVTHYQKTFGAALVVSPSVWWSERFILRDIQSQFTAKGLRPRIWLDMGLQEGEEAVRDARALREVLLNKGWGASNLRYLEDSGGSHDEASWAGRVEGMLLFLYGKN
ncbi:MAG: hypothetical protein H7Y28_00880 [Rhodoferax sp.]|nr:hypothetical protein [Rhodoferax sp.]